VKVLIQRVSRAAVHVDGETVGSIGPGLLVFLGVEQRDDERDVEFYADKTATLRIFPDDAKPMNRSVEDHGGSVLVVSQFTLASSTRRGRRPSFTAAAEPGKAERLYESFCERLEGRGLTVARGRFRAMMDVELVNDGPVTILLDPPGSGEEAAS
jgi:D-tyrosyl-tRNA(Tyr) deacylase